MGGGPNEEPYGIIILSKKKNDFNWEFAIRSLLKCVFNPTRPSEQVKARKVETPEGRSALTPPPVQVRESVSACSGQ